MNILIADDSSTMRRIIKKTITSLGEHNVIEAEDGLDALKKISTTDIPLNLIMLDIHMPKIDGMKTLVELKKNPATAGIPVIMCTSDSDKEVVIQCLRDGAADFIVKPFNAETFAEKVAKVIK